jgi:hypothetical protein
MQYLKHKKLAATVHMKCTYRTFSRLFEASFQSSIKSFCATLFTLSLLAGKVVSMHAQSSQTPRQHYTIEDSNWGPLNPKVEQKVQQDSTFQPFKKLGCQLKSKIPSAIIQQRKRLFYHHSGYLRLGRGTRTCLDCTP